MIVRSDRSDNFRSFTKKLVVVEDAFAEKRNNQLVDFKNGCCNNGEFGVLLFLAIIYLHFVPLLEPIRYMRKLTEEFIATNR